MDSILFYDLRLWRSFLSPCRLLLRGWRRIDVSHHRTHARSDSREEFPRQSDRRDSWTWRPLNTRSVEWGESLSAHKQHSVLINVGPQSRKILSLLSGYDFSNENFPPNSAAIIKIKDSSVGGTFSVRALRVSFVGELGYELHIPKESCTKVYNAVMQVGSSLGLKNAGYRSMYSLSSEKGSWTVGMRDDNRPFIDPRLEIYLQDIICGALTYDRTTRQSRRIWALPAANSATTKARMRWFSSRATASTSG